MQNAQAKVASATKSVLEKLQIPAPLWQKSQQQLMQTKPFQ